MKIKKTTLSICINQDLEKEVCALDDEGNIITIFTEQEVDDFIEKWQTTDWNVGQEAILNTRFLLEERMK